MEEIMSKELFMDAHEELIEEYMELHPEVSEAVAYDRTADFAHDRMTDKLYDHADHLNDVRKGG
jgi:hypothetical protein